MRVPLTVADFLDRAVTVYGDRVAVVDEPDQPAPSWGEPTWRRVGELARAQAAGLDALGVGHGERVAIVSPQLRPSPHVVLRCVRPGAGSSCRSTSASTPSEVQYIVEHSGASVLLVDPELEGDLGDVSGAKYRFTIGAEADDALLRFDTEPEPWAEPDEDATATINYTSGTTARPKGVQLTHRNVWLNAATFALHLQVSDRDVYLHTLPMFHCNGWGMTYGVTGLGGKHIVLRKVDGAEILRRIDAPRRHAAVRRAGRGRRRPRRRRVLGRSDPRCGHGPDRRRRCAAADSDDRAGRDRARMGVQPDLRPDRDLAARSPSTAAGPSGTT